MNITRLQTLLGIMASLSIASLSANTEAIHVESVGQKLEHTLPSPFEQDNWKTSAEKLNNLMKINPNRLDGIKAMYVAKIKAADYLEHQKTRAAHLTPEQTIDERTKQLLAPVEKFLPQVKTLKKLIAPLIEISLNRAPTEDELDLDASIQKHLTFNDSLFKKSLDTKEEINAFIATHIKNEEDFTQLCEEFHRVFSDLLNHAFPELKHEFEKKIEEIKKQKAAQVAATAA